jgi:hypothetical protein
MIEGYTMHHKGFGGIRTVAIAGLAALGSIIVQNAGAQEPALKETRYPVSLEDFPNPERGWYHYEELSGSTGFDKANNSTIAFLKIRADAYKTTALPSSLLDNLQKAFDAARQNGIKVIPRVAYNDGPGDGCLPYGCDASKAIIKQHIAQLAPLWKKNKDVTYIMDLGFIGGWGEWHSSSNGLDNKADRTDILFTFLDSLPPDRMTYIRYPAFKREIFGGSYTSEKEILGADRAFDKSRISRVGHLNDCFVSGEDDVGTYQHTGWAMSREIAYIGGESRYAPFGGETCDMHARGECANTLKEMAALHIDHLNHDYLGSVISRWGTQGCLDTINLKLGHRLGLEWAMLPDSVKPGGTLQLRFAIRNHGFGELFNPRDVEVVLYQQGGRLDQAVLAVDPRFWAGGSSDTMEVALSVPTGLPPGAWKLGLRLADKDASIKADPRYSIRFANTGMWNAASGINDLKANLVVSPQAPGASNPAYATFKVVSGAPVWIRVGERSIGPGNHSLIRDGRGGLRISPSAADRAGRLDVRLLTLDGRAVRSWRIDAAADGTFRVPLEESPAGRYLLEAGKGIHSRKWPVRVGTASR